MTQNLKEELEKIGFSIFTDRGLSCKYCGMDNMRVNRFINAILSLIEADRKKVDLSEKEEIVENPNWYQKDRPIEEKKCECYSPSTVHDYCANCKLPIKPTSKEVMLPKPFGADMNGKMSSEKRAINEILRYLEQKGL